jgi:hypothetical protein
MSVAKTAAHTGPRFFDAATVKPTARPPETIRSSAHGK